MKALEMGIYDDLDNQTQPLLTADVLANNIIAFGGHMAGKTTFLKTMLVRMHQNIPKDDCEEIYIIDFAGNLADYAILPLVAACFDASNEENIRRLFRSVENKLEENIKRLGSSQFLDAYNAAEGERPRHLTLMIDNITSFFADERYVNYQETLLKFCRDGLSKGLSLVFTASDTGNGLGRFLGSFGLKYAFGMESDKYIEIFGMKINEPMKNPGRGVAVIGGKPREFQAFLPFRDEKEELNAFFLDVGGRITHSAERLHAFKDELNTHNFSDYAADACTVEAAETGDTIVVGLDYYEHKPVLVKLHEMHSIAIYGKKKFGKTNLLAVLLRSIRKKHPDYRVVLFDDGRRQLLPFHLPDSANSVYLDKIELLSAFMDQFGYAAKGKKEDFTEQDTPPTVFVLQNKMLYQTAGKQLLKTFSDMTAKAEEKGYYFIFSDIRRISNGDRETEAYLNNSFSVAFLLDNIAEFIQDKGSRSVFGEMDPKELKNEYARCDLGDGFYYDIESDELLKIKFLKA